MRWALTKANAMRQGKNINSRRVSADHTAGLTTSLSLIDSSVDQHFNGLRSTVRACLAVCATMSLKGRTKPLTLILEGGSGSGKTAALAMFMPKAEPKLNDYIY